MDAMRWELRCSSVAILLCVDSNERLISADGRARSILHCQLEPDVVADRIRHVEVIPFRRGRAEPMYSCRDVLDGEHAREPAGQFSTIASID